MQELEKNKKETSCQVIMDGIKSNFGVQRTCQLLEH